MNNDFFKFTDKVVKIELINRIYLNLSEAGLNVTNQGVESYIDKVMSLTWRMSKSNVFKKIFKKEYYKYKQLVEFTNADLVPSDIELRDKSAYLCKEKKWGVADMTTILNITYGLRKPDQELPTVKNFETALYLCKSLPISSHFLEYKKAA